MVIQSCSSYSRRITSGLTSNTVRLLSCYVEHLDSYCHLNNKIPKQDTNKKVNLPREIRSVRELELVRLSFLFLVLVDYRQRDTRHSF